MTDLLVMIWCVHRYWVSYTNFYKWYWPFQPFRWELLALWFQSATAIYTVHPFPSRGKKTLLVVHHLPLAISHHMVRIKKIW